MKIRNRTLCKPHKVSKVSSRYGDKFNPRNSGQRPAQNVPAWAPTSDAVICNKYESIGVALYALKKSRDFPKHPTIPEFVPSLPCY